MADNPAIITSAMPMKPDRLMCSRQKISPQIVENIIVLYCSVAVSTGCPEPNARVMHNCAIMPKLPMPSSASTDCHVGLGEKPKTVMPMRPVAVMLMENSITVRHSGSPS